MYPEKELLVPPHPSEHIPKQAVDWPPTGSFQEPRWVQWCVLTPGHIKECPNRVFFFYSEQYWEWLEQYSLQCGSLSEKKEEVSYGESQSLCTWDRFQSIPWRKSQKEEQADTNYHSECFHDILVFLKILDSHCLLCFFTSVLRNRWRAKLRKRVWFSHRSIV